MNDPVLVFDIGGTNLRGALYCPDTDRLLASLTCPTPHFSDFKENAHNAIRDALIFEMTQLGTHLLNGILPQTVSVAFPGPIDATGHVLSAPTVWGRAEDKPVQIGQSVQQIWPQSKIILLNDVSAAGYNYAHQSCEDVCIVTVSSGIGHKVFINGEPCVGRGGHGGEIGHWRVDHSDNAPTCECGHKGHLGAMASGRASHWQAGKLYAENPSDYFRSSLSDISSSVDGLNNEDFVSAFHAQDNWSQELISRLARPLGNALSGIHLIIGVERFVLIGGFALALGDDYRRLVAESAANGGWDLGVNWDGMIELGDTINDAGLIGAGRYACRSHT